MRILEGVGTLIQLAGLIARLCKLVCLFFRDFLRIRLTEPDIEYEAGFVQDIAI